MIIAAIIIGSILITFVILSAHASVKRYGTFDNGMTLGIIIAILIFIEAYIISCIISEPTPTALNVYQGKTTLEITYKDSIPVDSVVVFKDEFKK